jgi:YidC/Oxa1 family membrane protein insertase
MDSRRLVIFIILSLGLLILWEKYVNPEQATPNSTVAATQNTTPASNNQIASDNSATNLQQDKLITVTTNVMQAQISTVGGDLRDVSLLAHGSQDNVKEPYKLLMYNKDRTFIAQTGLVSNSGVKLPNHHTIFSADKFNYTMEPNQNSLTVSLKSNENGIDVIKTYTFNRDSYIVDVGYQIVNTTPNPLSGVSAYWSILRDENAPDGETKFVHTFTGPAYYSSSSKFETLKFSNVNKNDVSYPENTNNGWVGFIQHYFATLWLLNANNHQPVCTNGIVCRLSFKPMGNNLISAGVLTDLPAIAANTTFGLSVPLFVGPEAYNVLTAAAPHLELTKDYGWVYIFATPLFWLLVKLFDFVHNWGYAIILLTLTVKLVLYPLTRASYISMAKMKALAPKMEQLKKQHGEDRAKLQAAMMQLYKTEKVNPIGGCLPMILQIPVFIGLYWALLSSVELRHAGFLWIHDLSTPDPYYILPVILAGTMFLQTFLNPPPSDPVQAKMMKIMPVAFSVMFFFFPAGLVLYWLVNNILSMAQQWYVNKHVTLRRANRNSK